MTTLTLKAKQDFLQRVGTTRDPIKAVAEFVWNALDADASNVEVGLLRNELDGLQAIRVTDDGTGITRERAVHDFESAGESWKRKKRHTAQKSRALHGKEGLGRLRFYSLANKARWNTTYAEGKERFKLDITLDAGNLQSADVSEPVLAPSDAAIGTSVELAPLKETFDWLSSDQARAEFGSIFAPYILQYKDVRISFDGQLVDPNATIETAFDVPRATIVCPNRTVRDLVVRIIEWKSGVGSRKIHFGGERGIVLGTLNANITAPNFDFSIYAYSALFEEIANANLLEFDGLSDPDFARVVEHIREAGTDYFRARQAEKAGQLIDDLKSAGVYPYEGEPRDDVEKREREVFDIATHAVSSYSREFKKADNPFKKITLSLLKEAVSRNPDSLIRILTAVFDLPKSRQDEFSSLLGKTELGNIIAASTLVADRIAVVKTLRHMVFDPKHRQTTKERGELDVLVRDNTWIFGENFHMTMPEAGLTKIMDRVSEELALKRASRSRTRKLDGKIGRVDSFMGREVPKGNRQHREYLLVELKRPSTIVGRKELDQLEDYVTAIVNQPDYVNTTTTWNFYLATTEYSDVVAPRINQADRAPGLYLDGENYKVWVKPWGELIRDCEARLDFVQEKLRVEVSDEDIEQRISHLRESMVKAARGKPARPPQPPDGTDDSAPPPP
jgi:hypothetical protein